jgi:hypothetical protein
MDNFHPVVSAGNLIGDFARSIRTPVIDNDYLEVGAEPGKDIEGPLNGAADIIFFIVTRKKYADGDGRLRI